MRKKFNAILLFLLISSEIVIGKESNKSKTQKSNNKKQTGVKEKTNTVRHKRSTDDDDGRPFWANRGKKQINDEPYFNTKYDNVLEKPNKLLKERDNVEKEPFWGTRGRRDSSSVETYEDTDVSYENPDCKYCYDTVHKYDHRDSNFKDRREDRVMPFWGNRGRRSSDEYDSSEPFWGNRGRRQAENDPFWGTRGRRTESAFRGNNGRGEDEPFWGNRGRREEQEPFWGNRGRRQDSEPFWGTRGRRQETEPFWGTRGRRDEEPFWGTRGRRRGEEEVFWGSRGRKKENLKASIMEAISDVENDIDRLSRLRRSEPNFWSNRGRESKLNYLFNGPVRNKISPGYLSRNFDMNLKAEPGTVHDSRIYAEEPHYIVVERSSRSSAEEDPFFISRGKKYYFNYNLVKAARDRRGALEEIVKSVKNDPYFIARGKKDADTNDTSTLSDEEFNKVKELICSAIDLISAPKEKGKIKREIDSDRDRRTILKKLAAQLQIDPYYVSRGKKSDVTTNEDNLGKFITDIAKKCV